MQNCLYFPEKEKEEKEENVGCRNGPQKTIPILVN